MPVILGLIREQLSLLSIFSTFITKVITAVGLS